MASLKEILGEVFDECQSCQIYIHLPDIFYLINILCLHFLLFYKHANPCSLNLSLLPASVHEAFNLKKSIVSDLLIEQGERVFTENIFLKLVTRLQDSMSSNQFRFINFWIEKETGLIN